MTRSFWLLSGLLIAMMLAGLLTINRGILALTLPVLVYLLVAAHHAPSGGELQVTRQMSTDRITQGVDVIIKVQVTNADEMTEELHLSESLPLPAQSLEGSLTQVVALAPRENFVYEYTLQGWRGNYKFEQLSARRVDNFGLFEIREELSAPGNVLVYPDVTQLKPIPIRPPHTKGFSGPIPARKSGAGMDFFGVRQYHLGDSLRHVNWKTSARHIVDLFTNEYEQEQIADVGLILDARPHCDLSIHGQSLFEYSVQATAALAEMFLNQGHCLSMLIYSAAILRVFPGYGKIQRERILRALANAETGTNRAMAHLSYHSARMLPPRGQLVYISPLATEDLESLLRIRSQGYQILVVTPDPLDIEQQSADDTAQPDFQLALRFAQIERYLLCRNLHRAGIQVINWQVGRSLSAVLEQVRLKNILNQRAPRLLQ